MRLIYLANPYHDYKPEVMEARYRKTMEILAKLSTETTDLHFYSPIINWHEIASRYELPTDFTWWRERDLFMIRKSSALWVIPLPGWEESFGVTQEIEFATDIGRPVLYVLDYDPSVVVTDTKPTNTLALD